MHFAYSRSSPRTILFLSLLRNFSLVCFICTGVVSGHGAANAFLVAGLVLAFPVAARLW